MLSQSRVSRRSKNFTSDGEVRVPPTVPLNHDSGPADQRNGRSPVPLFHAYVSRRRPACLEHSNFFKVNAAGPARTQPRARAVSARRGAAPPDGGGPRPRGGGAAPAGGTPRGGPAAPPRSPTTSFLTAATLIYAIGAGITAAAGTRLALQSILARGFASRPFRLRDSRRGPPHRYFSSLPPRVGIG